jgi:hypothetical protein
MVKRFILLALIAVAALCQQAVIATQADVSGDGANHAIGTGPARWIQFIAPTTNAAVVRIGNSSISSTQGSPMAAGSGFLMPPLDQGQGSPQAARYNLANVYYRVAIGDKLSISWGY